MAPPRIQHRLSGLMGLLLVLLALHPMRPALADDAVDEGVGLLAGLRGVGEVWQDPYLIQDIGRSSRFGGTGFMSYRVWRFVGVDIEAGYHRMAGTGTTPNSGRTLTDATRWEMVPLALSASAVHRVGAVEVFGSVGTAFTVYTSTDSVGAITGTKVGPAFHAGARLDTGMVVPTIRRDAPYRLRSLDLELVVGRRQHQCFGVGEGLNLSAWRVGVGLLARL